MARTVTAETSQFLIGKVELSPKGEFYMWVPKDNAA